jgi:sugar O-acyltransferase (sialic acid O-acetyltransferase NeuD family)
MRQCGGPDVRTVQRVVLWGGTGQAKVLRECLEHAGARVVAVFDNNQELGSPFPDVPLYHGWSGFEAWRTTYGGDGVVGCLVAIGGERGRERHEIQRALSSRGLVPVVAQHPTAFVAGTARVGAGSQILAQSAVCVEAVLGEACIVNTGATIDHECRIGDGVHVCPGAHLAGCVVVEDHVTVGTAAAVLPGVRIGRGAVVGAGAVVLADVAPGAVVVGNPGRVAGFRD